MTSTSTRSSSRSVTRGVLYVHSTPSALCPHIEWAVGGVLGVAVNPVWTPQPAQQGSYRTELSWTGDAGSDHQAVADGYISVTPLHMDLTNYKLLDTVRGWALDK